MMRLALRHLGIITLITSYVQISHAHHCHLNFGTCSSPSIQYGFNIDGSQRYGYAATNGQDFPHGWSPDIATIESFICNRLESPCNAPPKTVQICRAAFNLYSGLTGEIAIHAWNEALGLPNDDGNGDHGNHACILPPNDDYLATTTLTVYAPRTIYPISTDIESTTTTTTQTLTTETISTKTKIYTFSPTTSALTPSSTLTITITLPSPTTHQAGHTISTPTLTSTSTTLTTQTNEATTSVAAAQTSNPNNPDPNHNGNDNDGAPGGGSPFDPESNASSPSSSLSRSDSSWPPLAYFTSVPGLLTLVMGFMV